MPIDSSLWPVVTLLAVQAILLGLFTFFSFFNYLYAIASLWKPNIQRVKPSGEKVAVVVVAFNEKYVLENTIKACDELTYENKLTVLADDSTDPEIIESLRNFAQLRECKQLHNHPFTQEILDKNGLPHEVPIEIWESPGFVFFHRPDNAGFKGGSLQKVCKYLDNRNINLMYLLDADWHPQHDVLERTLEVLEADENTAFVQTKRVSFPKGMNLFQKYVTLVEEGCYYVDFVGRQNLGHPTLFSGCCTLFRLEAIASVGGFTPGHLTEDLDLTDRLWLNNWKGIYLEDVLNYGEVPFTYDHYRRQQERWASGSARAFKDFFWPILKCTNFNWIHKLSAIRQNAYFTTTLLTGVAILQGMTTIIWLITAWNSYAVEYYLYVMGLIKTPLIALVYWCIFANLVEPLVMVFFKKKSYRDIFHIPMMVWYAWSIIPTYVIGNIKGLLGVSQKWFCTPKFVRSQIKQLPTIPTSVRIVNLCVCMAALGFYFSEAWVFGWFDEFAILIVPAFLIASVK